MISWKKIENYKYKDYQYKEPRPPPKPIKQYFLFKIPLSRIIRFD